MSQVPVKWVYETFDEKPPEIKAGQNYVLRATGDMDILPHAVVPLSALREVVENMCDQAITNMDAARQPSCSCYLDGLNNLLASLGEK